MIAELSLKNFKTKQTIYRIVSESLTEYHQRSPMELLVRSLFLDLGYQNEESTGRDTFFLDRLQFAVDFVQSLAFLLS